MQNFRPSLFYRTLLVLSLVSIYPAQINSLQMYSVKGDSSVHLVASSDSKLKDDDSNTTTIRTDIDLVHGQDVQSLLCEADEPIEWVYSGDGRPSKIEETTVRTETNLVQSTLKFNTGGGNNTKKFTSREYSEHTGRYTCRTLKKNEFNSSVYIYFSDENKVFLQENEHRDQLFVPSPVPIYTDLTGPQNLIIPCVSTSSNVTVNLYKKYFKGKKLKLQLIDQVYNPKVGFALPIPKNITKLNSLPGEYLCVANTTRRNNATFIVNPPKLVTVKAWPSESIIYIGKELNFTCESNEPVFIKETESNLALYDDLDGEGLEELPTEDEIEETTEISPTSLHVANHIDLNPIPGSFGVFQCQRDNDERHILHSWKYFVIGKEADELSGLKYSKKKGEFRCRSKSNQPGLLSFVSCSTPSECAVNRVCLQRWDSCTGYDFPIDSPTRCKSASKKSKFRFNEPCTKIIHHGGSSGYVRCVAEGIDEIRGFNANGLLPKNRDSDELNMSLKTGNVPLKLKLTLNTIMAQAEDGFKRFNLTLERSNFDFIGGHKWTANLENGSSVDVTAESEKVDRSSTDLTHSVIKISNEVLPHAIKIICKVPMRDSMEWKDVGVVISEGRISIDSDLSTDNETKTESTTSVVETEDTDPVSGIIIVNDNGNSTSIDDSNTESEETTDTVQVPVGLAQEETTVGNVDDEIL